MSETFPVLPDRARHFTLLAILTLLEGEKADMTRKTELLCDTKNSVDAIMNFLLHGACICHVLKLRLWSRFVEMVHIQHPELINFSLGEENRLREKAAQLGETLELESGLVTVGFIYPEFDPGKDIFSFGILLASPTSGNPSLSKPWDDGPIVLEMTSNESP